MKNVALILSFLFLLLSCAQSGQQENESRANEQYIRSTDIIRCTQPLTVEGNRTVYILLKHEVWVKFQDSGAKENHSQYVTLMGGGKSMMFYWNTSTDANNIRPSFNMANNDVAFLVLESETTATELMGLLSDVEMVLNKSALIDGEYPVASMMEVSPEWVEVDLNNGADFIVTTAEDSYIFSASCYSPAFTVFKKSILKKSFDKTFVEYEDEFISMEQTSGNEYHFVVKPCPDLEEESISWVFFFMPDYIDHEMLADGSVTIVGYK